MWFLCFLTQFQAQFKVQLDSKRDSALLSLPSEAKECIKIFKRRIHLQQSTQLKSFQVTSGPSRAKNQQIQFCKMLHVNGIQTMRTNLSFNKKKKRENRTMQLGMEIKMDMEPPATSCPIVTTAAASSLSDQRSQGSSAGPAHRRGGRSQQCRAHRESRGARRHPNHRAAPGRRG